MGTFRVKLHPHLCRPPDRSLLSAIDGKLPQDEVRKRGGRICFVIVRHT